MNEIDSMFDVLTSDDERIEKNEATKTDWLNWDEEIKIVIEFDFDACFFVEISIDSMTNRFVDILFEFSAEGAENSYVENSSRFSLIQMTDETW